MEAFLIRGGNRLTGELRVQNAKNAVLPIMAASILSEEKTVLLNCPDLNDIRNMSEILRALGCVIMEGAGQMVIDPSGLNTYKMPDALSKKLRSSIFMLGPILARFRCAEVTFPGGCEIGLRPIDLHLHGLRQLNVAICNENGYICCDGKNMRAGNVHFDYPSVGATENIMMAAVLLSGTTVVTNAAREPEIVDLQNLLNKMGAKISGAGSSTILIEGVKTLHGVEYEPMPDRIAAGTFLAAAAATKGELYLHNAPVEDMTAILSKLEEMGCRIAAEKNALRLTSPERLHAFSSLQTQPHPGFPTDMQAQMMAVASIAKDSSIVVENVFESRFAHAGDLNRMGARIMLNGRTALINGVKDLFGANVYARDLRGGAALVIAGLCARGTTTVENVSLIDRGYDHFEKTLRSLGADIDRITIT